MSAARSPRRLATVVAVAATAGVLALPSVATGAAAPHAPRARTLAAATLPRGATLVGATPSTERLVVSVYLEPRSPSALASFAASVSDVHSRSFRHYLARGEFAARFGPTAAAIRGVEAFARGAGLRVASLSANHLAVTLLGSAATFSAAFSTRLSEVRLPSGELGRAVTAPVHLPADVASSVAAVVGLNDVLHAHTSLRRPNELRRPTAAHLGRSFPTVRPRAIAGAPGACPAATEATQLGFGGITDDQVAHAYGADGLYSAGDLGAGQTVAIFELEPFLKSDVKAFEACYFAADHTSQLSVINVDGGQGSGPGGGEAALDVENVAAIAPAAKILVYQAPNTSFGSLDAYNRIVSDDRAQVVTSSWGFCETDQLNLSPGSLAAENLLFEQAAAQGQTVFNAGGDAGNDSCAYNSGFPTSPVLSVGDPASQPYVLGVGGTTAVTVSQPPAEQVWNDGALGGAGEGGISAVWAQPPWLGAKARALSSATPCHAPKGEVCRTTPDVSAFADEYTGITIYWDGQWTTIGGTSSSSPFWAGFLALINASKSCSSVASTAHGVGFAAPLLYRVAADPTDYASGFNDVTLGNNDVFGVTKGAYAARPGYDLASGLGSPQLTAAPGVTGPGLAASLCAAAQTSTTAHVTSVAPKRGSASGGTAFTITGTGFMKGTASDVTQVDFGTSPASHVKVVSSTELTGVTSSATTPTTSSPLNAVARRSGGALVSVTTSDGEVAIGPTFHYVVEASGKSVPTVVQVGPTGGAAAGGNTVELYGTGFTGAKKVTFGGEPASSFKVLSDVQIAAVAPRLTTASCLAASRTATLGLCQTQVQVTGPGGTSPVVAAKKPYSGFLNFNQLGVISVPKKCGCEAYPTVTEYDYVTAASLSKLTDESGAAEVGDPSGSGLLVLHGTGFNVLTLDWVDFGPPSAAASQDTGLLQLNAAGTKLEALTLSDPNPGPHGDSVAVSVATLAGSTDAKTFTYGAVPVVSSLSDGVLPSAGGTTLTIRGGGFLRTQQVVFAPFDGNDPPVIILKNFTVTSSTTITMPVPSMVPTAYQVFVCNQYTCGTGNPKKPTTATVQVIYPGTTAVTSAEADPGGAQPITGPTTGGTTFEVQGTNFGPLGAVTIYLENGLGEKVPATGVAAGPSATDPGATETLVATSPPSLAGAAETYAVVLVGKNGASAETASALFVYG